MGGLDPAKLLVILVLALVILGPERLPKAARQVGAFWRDLTAFRQRLEEEVRSAIPDVDLPDIPLIPRAGLTGYLAGMMRDSERRRPDAGGEATAAPAASAGPQRAALAGAPTGVDAPNGVPASWHSNGAEAPGYASGALLVPAPAAAPEALLEATARLELDDPSWN